MSLWQGGNRWTHRPNQLPAASRTPQSGNSSAAASTVSLLSTNGTLTPRQPSNSRLSSRQDGRRSSSLSQQRKTVDGGKSSDHDPLQTLSGIFGEQVDLHVGETKVQVQLTGERGEKGNAEGKTLSEWLEELTKDDSGRQSSIIAKRIYTAVVTDS